MPLNLTNAITVPNIQRIDLERAPVFFDNVCQCIVQIKSSGGNNRIKTVEIWARNAPERSDALMVNTTPVGFDDDIKVVQYAVLVSTAADQVEAAYRTGANKNAAIRAVLTTLQTLNIIQLVGSVGA